MKRDGKFIEMLGSYNPERVPKEFTFKSERMAYWLGKGATPSETIHNLLKQDRFLEKLEGMKKGLTAEQLNIERKPERKRKPKTIKVKKES
jgi:ribosomal protein S16